jgi:hypothetical protein
MFKRKTQAIVCFPGCSHAECAAFEIEVITQGFALHRLAVVLWKSILWWVSIRQMGQRLRATTHLGWPRRATRSQLLSPISWLELILLC